MYYYICPYCDPSPESYLEWVKVEEVKCKYDKEDTCEEEHKCKDTLRCKKCENQFKPNKAFLKEQKRKDKDG